MKITFDTNVLDKVLRVSSRPANTCAEHFVKINHSLISKKIKGYFCDSLITLEGIQNKDRLETFGNGISITKTIEQSNTPTETFLSE